MQEAVERQVWSLGSKSVFLPGKFHGPKSLVEYSPWGCEELDTTEHTHTHTHTHTQVCFPAQELKGEGRGPCRRLGPAAQAGASGVYIAVSSHPQSRSCNVLLFVMVEQLCVNISKSFKKPETQLHPVLIISPPCRSQASDVEETSA